MSENSDPKDKSPDERRAAESVSGEKASADKTASPEDRIAALEVEKQEMRDRMLRIAAEFENWKKRARKEQADGEAKAKEGVLVAMLEVIDNLERAAAAVSEATDPKAVQQGINLVLRLFQSKLERMDVKPFESTGQPFDPRVHDAISQVPTADAPPGSILSELQKGYRLGDRLLRPASVVVAVAPPGSGQSPAPPPQGAPS
jgi:molecular chaperone GrpE